MHLSSAILHSDFFGSKFLQVAVLGKNCAELFKGFHVHTKAWYIVELFYRNIVTIYSPNNGLWEERTLHFLSEKALYINTIT